MFTLIMQQAEIIPASHLAFDFDQTDPIDALLSARKAFPYATITLDVVTRENWSLVSNELEWLTDEYSGIAILIDPNHPDVLKLCNECSDYIEDGIYPNDTPPAELLNLSDSIFLLGYSVYSRKPCAGCGTDIVTGTNYYTR